MHRQFRCRVPVRAYDQGVSQVIAGLGGVLLGAVLTGGWTLVLRRREERAELRETCRLLVAALNPVILAAQNHPWYPGDEMPLLSRADLLRSKAMLARRLRGKDWAVWPNRWTPVERTSSMA